MNKCSSILNDAAGLPAWRVAPRAHHKVSAIGLPAGVLVVLRPHWVGQYRIGEAKRLLSGIDSKKKTVLEIIYESGFYSKSVFNTAFKKFTGQTPSEYKKSHLN